MADGSCVVSGVSQCLSCFGLFSGECQSVKGLLLVFGRVVACGVFLFLQ